MGQIALDQKPTRREDFQRIGNSKVCRVVKNFDRKPVRLPVNGRNINLPKRYCWAHCGSVLFFRDSAIAHSINHILLEAVLSADGRGIQPPILLFDLPTNRGTWKSYGSCGLRLGISGKDYPKMPKKPAPLCFDSAITDSV